MVTEEPRALPRALRPFRHRDYRLLVGATALSLFGSGMWIVALVWQVMAIGGGPGELSIVATASSVGMLATVLLGGVAADRLPRRALLIGVEALRIAGSVAVGLLGITGTLQLWHLALIGFVLGCGEAVYFPAYTALLPSMLPPEELLAANGVEGTMRPIAQQALGPAAAGVLVGAFNPSLAILVAGASYLVALLVLLMMRTRSVPEASEGATVLRDLRDGFAYLFRTGWLFATLAFSILYVLLIIGPIEVLLPFAVRDNTGSGAGGFAFVIGAFGIGGAIGSFATSSFRLPRHYLTVMLLLWGAGALPLVLLGFTSQLWAMATITFVVGFTGSAAMVIWGTLLQRRVPPTMLGRVSSLDFFVSLSLMPISMALAGPVGVWLGVPLTFVLAGALPVFLAIAAILCWRLPRDELANPLDTADAAVR